MEILDSALGRDIENITQASNVFKRQYWTADLHNPKETVSELIKVLSFDKIRDYEGNFADEVIITILIPAGKYAYRVYPYLDNLEFTLYKHSPKNIATRLDGADSISHERFTATVLNPPATTVEMNSRNQPSEHALDLNGFVELQIQLLNKAVDQMRMRTVGGNYRNCTAEEVIKSILTTESQKLEVSSEYLPKGVDMVPVVSPLKRDHILVKQGTRLVDVPSYIHQHCGGVYSTGFSHYFQNGLWYVYPTYNTTRFEKTPKTMTIINVPAMQMPGSEKTYLLDGNHLTIMATGQTKVLNASEKLILNHGNGVRFADGNFFMESFAETLENKAVASRGKTNNEFITIQRDSTVNNVLMSPTRITANPLLEYSKLAARDGSMMLVSWENSDPDLIYPGMPVRLKYLDGQDIKQVDGVVLKVHNYTQLVPGDGIMNNRHISTTNMSLFIKRTIFKKPQEKG
jgi:hypothetical protein